MSRVVIDFETRSTVDLKKRGAWVYAEDASTEVMCLAYKFRGEEPVVLRGSEITTDSVARILMADTILAHNAQFEYAIWKHVLGRRGIPMLPILRLHCTAARAAACALPRSLEQVCQVLGLSVQKDMEGHALMMRLCKPRPPRQGESIYGTYWHESEAELQRLMEYCAADTLAEEALDRALPELSETEQRIWRLDLTLNDRGIAADREFALEMINFTQAHEGRLLRRLAGLTQGAVRTGKQVEALKKYLRGVGCDMEDLSAKSVSEALRRDDLTRTARDILEVRQSLSRSSAAKYSSILDRASADGRIRGSLLYHGAATGRWSGAGIQPQNFPSRLKTSVPVEEMIPVIKVGHLPLFDAVFDDDPMTAAGALTRSALVASPGHDLVVADYSAIEGRGIAWLAGDERELEIYRSGQDVYIATAARILGKRIEDVTKDERQSPGKIAVLACIAEGSLVVTDHGLVPIEKVRRCMRVWDGVEWVCHEGVVFRGVKEVMSYDGLQATPDHVVFTETGASIPLREAAGKGIRLRSAGPCGGAFWDGGDSQPQIKAGVGIPEGILSVFGMRGREVGKSGQPPVGEDGGMSAVQPTQGDASLASEEAVCGPRPMREPEEPGLCGLRRTGDRVPIPVRHSGGLVGGRQSGVGSNAGAGPGGQRRPLRAGESAVGHAVAEREQLSGEERDLGAVPSVSNASPRCAVCGQHLAGIYPSGAFIPRDPRAVSDPELQAERPVWDILNCGPRHRFAVSGVIVHNCGYQGSVNAVRKFGGEGMTDEEIKERIVDPWRDAHPVIVDWWYRLEDACMEAVRYPDRVTSARSVEFKVKGMYLMIKLPSGRLLRYHAPDIRPCATSWGEMKDCVTYNTVNSVSKKWVRTNTYGGKLAENITQAVCRDLMAHAMLALEDSGYPIVLTVHDEIISEVPESFGSIEEFENIMSYTPGWADGFPVDAKGWRGKRYKK